MQHTLSNHRSERDSRNAHWNWGARDRLLREEEDQLWAAYWKAEQTRRKLDRGELTETQARHVLAPTGPGLGRALDHERIAAGTVETY